jgi:hypothetical protein
MDVLHDVFGSRVLSNRFPERFGYGRSWPPCSPDIPSGLPQRWCVPHQPTYYLGFASGNWSCCWRDHMWHVAWHSWLLRVSFTARKRGWRIAYWTCVRMKSTCAQTLHEREFSFMYHMRLSSRKFANISYIETVACFSEYSVYFVFISLFTSRVIIGKMCDVTSFYISNPNMINMSQ